VNRAGKRTVRPERVVCVGRVVLTCFSGSLRGWADGRLPVSCWIRAAAKWSGAMCRWRPATGIWVPGYPVGEYAHRSGEAASE